MNRVALPLGNGAKPAISSDLLAVLSSRVPIQIPRYAPCCSVFTTALVEYSHMYLEISLIRWGKNQVAFCCMSELHKGRHDDGKSELVTRS